MQIREDINGALAQAAHSQEIAPLDPFEEEFRVLVTHQLELQSRLFERIKLYEAQRRKLEQQEEVLKQQELVIRLCQDMQIPEFGMLLPQKYYFSRSCHRLFARVTNLQERTLPVDSVTVYVPVVRITSQRRLLVPTQREAKEGMICLD